MTDKQLIKFVRDFTKGCAGGKIDSMCYALSSPIASYLELCGVPCDLINVSVTEPDKVWIHWLIQLKDGRYLDPTSGQFKSLNLPKIYVGFYLPENYSLNLFKKEHIL